MRNLVLLAEHMIRMTKTGVWVLFIILCMGCSGRRDQEIRVACLPGDGPYPWADWVVAEACVRQFDTDFEAVRVLPLKHAFEAFPRDSLSDPFVLKRGRALNLDRVLIPAVIDPEPEGTSVAWRILDCRSGMVRFDTISWNRDFVHAFVNEILPAPNKAFKPGERPVSIASTIPPFAIWREYGEARKAWLHRDFNRAASLFRHGISKEAHAWMIKGLIESLLDGTLPIQDFQESEAVFQEAGHWLRQGLQKDSSDAELWLLAGRAYIQRRWWNKAEQALRKAWTLYPHNSLILFYLSRLHPERYRFTPYKSKRDLLKAALHWNPAFTAAWIDLGDLHYNQNRYRAAEKTYRRLLTLMPESEDGWLALARLHTIRQDRLAIIQVYEKIIELYPDMAQAYYNLGIVYYNDGKTETAERLFQRALNLEPHVNSHFYLGLIALDRGDTARAVTHLRRRIENKDSESDFYAEEARKKLSDLLSIPVDSVQNRYHEVQTRRNE
ncbi:MAG TPA: tetratricopeptide repeat protein [bacterium]|nr:tetratricopeptide repeat protein [bacterium]